MILIDKFQQIKTRSEKKTEDDGKQHLNVIYCLIHSNPFQNYNVEIMNIYYDNEVC